MPLLFRDIGATARRACTKPIAPGGELHRGRFMWELPYVCLEQGVAGSDSSAVKTGDAGGSTIMLASQPVLPEPYLRRFQA